MVKKNERTQATNNNKQFSFSSSFPTSQIPNPEHRRRKNIYKNN